MRRHRPHLRRRNRLRPSAPTSLNVHAPRPLRLEPLEHRRVLAAVFELADLLPANGGDGTVGFRLDGIHLNDESGISVSTAGDVNGDGFDDLLVGARSNENGVGADVGGAFIVFGKPGPFTADVELGDLDGTDGFAFEGEYSNSQTGIRVRSLGDFNGDGLDDLAVGAITAKSAPLESAGQTYVIFGSTSPFPAVIDPSFLDGTTGFVLNGVADLDRFGSVGSPGDVNGDGLDDLLVGAYLADPGGLDAAGESYLIFGSTTPFPASFDVANLDGTNGFTVPGIDEGDRLGRHVGPAGDVNGDGFADLLIAALQADPGGVNDAGEVYLIFGSSSAFPATFDLTTLDGTSGVVLEGIGDGDRAGRAVGTAGDVNGDGLDDLIIGAYRADVGAATGAGETYVVFGRTTPFPTTIDLATLDGTDGFALQGIVSGDNSGVSAATAGDVNGDGFDDVLVGAYFASPGGAILAGETYLVFGHAGPFAAAFDLSTLDGNNGIQFNGVGSIDVSGISVHTAGDVNGDGLHDFLIGAPLGSAGDPGGESYLIFGDDFTSAVTHPGDDTANLLTGTPAADSIIAGADNDTLIGAGGTDVLRAGQGDDLIKVADTAFVRADGGRGFDTLELGNFNLDLTTIPDNRLTGIEAIDLATAPGPQTLTLSKLELLNLSDTSNTLLVTGTSADTADLGPGTWTRVAKQTVNAELVHVYTQGNATLLVSAPMNLVGAFVIAADFNSDGSADGLDANILSANWLDFPTGGATLADGDANGDGMVNALDANILSQNWLAQLPATTAESTSQNAATESSEDDPPIAVFNLADLLPENGGDGTDGFVLNGIDPGDIAGFTATGAGDINGDGFDDLLIGARYAEPNGLYNAGESYLVFGGPTQAPAAFDLSTLDGTNGFILEGINVNDAAGFRVARPGDVNGDGFHDLMISSQYRRPDGVQEAHDIYIIFGKSEPFPLHFDLASLDGENGFVINGIDGVSYTHSSISGAGDVNGDGLEDLLVGVYHPSSSSYAGRSFLVFGSVNPGPMIDLNTLDGTNGFSVEGVDITDRAGQDVGSAGDLNRDGYDDILIGAPGGDPVGASNGGETYVIFGKADGFVSNFELTSLNGTNGFVLYGIEPTDSSGRAVSTAGDHNGDGIDDLLIGAPFVDSGGITGTGGSFVFYGMTNPYPSSLDLPTNGSDGFVIHGSDTFDLSGIAASHAGDLNGDGFDEVIIGAYNAGTGQAYVVFGASTPFSGEFSVDELDGTNGFKIQGNGHTGRSVNTAGDFNGDGFADILVGADAASPNGAQFAGQAYLIYGRDFTASVTHLGDETPDLLTGTPAADAIVAGADNDTLIGAGGPDVLRAGQGDDLIKVADTTFFRADGSRGFDTLEIGNFNLDLTAIPDNKLTGIEAIDLATAAGPNTLTLSKLELLNLSDTSNTLRVTGTADDSIDLGPGTWTRIAQQTINSELFHVYSQGNATLLVSAAMNLVGTIVLAADFNSDGFANALDVNILSANWLDFPGGSANLADGDANGDGLVNALDANILSLNWLAQLPAASSQAAAATITDSLTTEDPPDLIADLAAGISANFAQPTTPANAFADLNTDGFTDGVVDALDANHLTELSLAADRLDLRWLAARLALETASTETGPHDTALDQLFGP